LRKYWSSNGTDKGNDDESEKKLLHGISPCVSAGGPDNSGTAPTKSSPEPTSVELPSAQQLRQLAMFAAIRRLVLCE
jgi:hypothetical protein